MIQSARQSLIGLILATLAVAGLQSSQGYYASPPVAAAPSFEDRNAPDPVLQWSGTTRWWYVVDWRWINDPSFGGVWDIAENNGVVDALIVGRLDLRSVPQTETRGTVGARQCCALIASNVLLNIGPTVTYAGASFNPVLTDGEAGAVLFRLGLSPLAEPSGAAWEFWRRVIQNQGDATGATRWMGVLPGRDGRVRIQLAEETIAARTPLVGSDEWANILAIEQQTYRDIRERALNPRDSTPDDLHQKWLMLQGRKYWRSGVDNAAAVFIPDDLPREPPKRPRTSFSDDFGTTAEAELSDAGNLTWTDVSGDWEISVTGAPGDGFATVSSGTNATSRADHDVSSADHWTDVDLEDSGNTAVEGPLARFDSSANTFYGCGAADGSGNDRKMFEFNAGSPSIMAQDNTAPTIPSTWRVEVSGSDVECFEDGGSILGPTTDATPITGNTRGGIIGTGGAGSTELDNWQIDDGVAAGARKRTHVVLLSD